jgi:hypothetical protein
MHIKEASKRLWVIFSKYQPALNEKVDGMNDRSWKEEQSFVLETQHRVYTHGPDCEPYVVQASEIIFRVYDTRTTVKRFLWWSRQKEQRTSVIELKISLSVGTGGEGDSHSSLKCPQELRARLVQIHDAMMAEVEPLAQRLRWSH